jgi:hypothetical protein
MAVVVVESLEVVKVHHDHAHRPSVPTASPPFGVDVLLEASTVGQVGQAVLVGQLTSLAVQVRRLQRSGSRRQERAEHLLGVRVDLGGGNLENGDHHAGEHQGVGP